MDQPQSEIEIAPVRAALQQMDAQLDLRWNPRAKLLPSGYDAVGQPIPQRSEGRWEVIRHIDRDRPAVIYVVRTDATEGESGQYKPVGWWLVEFMRKWDAAQAHFADEYDKAWKAHEDAEARRYQLTDEGGVQEALEAFYRRQFGGETWIGRGADFAAPATPVPSPAQAEGGS